MPSQRSTTTPKPITGTVLEPAVIPEEVESSSVVSDVTDYPNDVQNDQSMTEKSEDGDGSRSKGKGKEKKKKEKHPT